jgi:hypothetical protein
VATEISLPTKLLTPVPGADPRPDGRTDLGQFPTAGGIELAKVHRHTGDVNERLVE